MNLGLIVFNEDQAQETLQDFAQDVERGVKAYIRRHVKGTGKLENSIRAHVFGRHIMVTSDQTYAGVVDRGRKSTRTQWELINQVIPIKLKGGRTIFRRVTLESIRRGKWRTGPTQGLDFVRKGAEEALGLRPTKDRMTFQVRKPTV